MPDAERELVGDRRFGVVVDQEDLGVRRDAAGDEAVEAGLAEVRRSQTMVGWPSRGAPSAEKRNVRTRVLQAEALVEAGVVEHAVVVAAAAAEDTCCPPRSGRRRSRRAAGRRR